MNLLPARTPMPSSRLNAAAQAVELIAVMNFKAAPPGRSGVPKGLRC